jgi:hypothetical protein
VPEKYYFLLDQGELTCKLASKNSEYLFTLRGHKHHFCVGKVNICKKQNKCDNENINIHTLFKKKNLFRFLVQKKNKYVSPKHSIVVTYFCDTIILVL